MQLPFVVDRLREFGLATEIIHLGEPGVPVTGLVLIDGRASLPVNDGHVRDDDLNTFMEELADAETEA